MIVFLLVFFMLVVANEWGICLENRSILQIKTHLVY